MDKKQLIGREGEAQAAAYLKQQGYTIVGQNFTCRYGEIDVIARKDPYIVFVEVKTRKNEEFASPRDFAGTDSKNGIAVAAEERLGFAAPV